MDLFDFIQAQTLRFQKRDDRSLWQGIKDWWNFREYCAICNALQQFRRPDEIERIETDAPMAPGLQYCICTHCNTWYIYGIDGLLSVRTDPALIQGKND